MWPWHCYPNPFWRVANRFAPIRLPFVPSVTDIREWKGELDPSTSVLQNPLPTDGVLKVSLHRLLIETGIANTLATSSWDPRSWYALYRYGMDFSGTNPRLRFEAGVANKDPRLTAVASEEIASGITCYLLREHLALPHIADVYACIQKNELEYVDPNSKARPDYFCEDSVGDSVIVESKGATGTRKHILRRIKPEGTDQVANVRSVNRSLRATCSRVVIGTHICIQGIHGKSETTSIIRDPEGQQSRESNPNSDFVIRLAYAKALRFMVQDAFAEALILQREMRLELDAFDPKWSILPLGNTPFGDVIGLYLPVAEALISNSHKNLLDPIRAALVDFQKNPPKLGFDGYSLSNGVIIVHNPEAIF